MGTWKGSRHRSRRAGGRYGTAGATLALGSLLTRGSNAKEGEARRTARRPLRARLVPLAVTIGSAAAMLAFASIGYSGWESTATPPAIGISTISGIPAPSNITVTSNDANTTYTLSWTPPSGTDYNGKPLAQKILVQADIDNNWVTEATLPGTATTYTVPGSPSVSQYRIVVADQQWVSNYGNQQAGAINGTPLTSVNPTPPPNYCGIHYTCDPIQAVAQVGTNGLGLYSVAQYGGANLGGSNDPTLTGPGQTDNYAWIATWSDYNNFTPGQQVYAYNPSTPNDGELEDNQQGTIYAENNAGLYGQPQPAPASCGHTNTIVDIVAADETQPTSMWKSNTSAEEYGYWVVDSEGNVYAEGNAPNYGDTATYGVSWCGTPGSTITTVLEGPIVQLVPNPNDTGYTLFAADGGVFTYNSNLLGNTYTDGFNGPTSSNPPPGGPFVGAAITPNDQGYWMVTKDGYVYPFGNAAPVGTFVGNGPKSGSYYSLGLPSGVSVVGVAEPSNDNGFWVLLSNGDVLAEAGAPYYGEPGSGAGVPTAQSYLAIARNPGGTGYGVMDNWGQIFGYGGAPSAPAEGAVGSVTTFAYVPYFGGDALFVNDPETISAPNTTTAPATGTTIYGYTGPYLPECDQPNSGSDGLGGGTGYGGGGGLGDGLPGNNGTPFGAGGASSGTFSGAGGYGGGGAGGNGWGGGGGGGGYVGGIGGNGWIGSGTDPGSGGQGGQSYVAPGATNVSDQPGAGGVGGTAGPGANGYVDITFYSSTGTVLASQQFSYTGNLQTVVVPSGTSTALITAAGAGGAGGTVSNTTGGGGDLLTAIVPIPSGTSTLDVLVGGGGQPPTSGDGSGGGGGMSGVFTGTPSGSDALVIAGGGGGGANDNNTAAQSNGGNGSLTPVAPTNNPSEANGTYFNTRVYRWDPTYQPQVLLNDGQAYQVPNAPIFAQGTTSLEPGWSISGTAGSYPAGYGSSPAQDGGWVDPSGGGAVTYTFTVAPGASTLVTYGLPSGGYANNGLAIISVNGQQVFNTADYHAAAGSTVGGLRNLWSDEFGPGTYTIEIASSSSSSGGINVYGLWFSNPSAVTPN